jgi:hypothetical protein
MAADRNTDQRNSSFEAPIQSAMGCSVPVSVLLAIAIAPVVSTLCSGVAKVSGWRCGDFGVDSAAKHCCCWGRLGCGHRISAVAGGTAASMLLGLHPYVREAALRDLDVSGNRNRRQLLPRTARRRRSIQ